MAANGLVEVYDASQRCFLPGYVRDLDKNKVQVQFETSDGRPAGKPKWFDWSVVREPPVQEDGEPLSVVRALALCAARTH